MALFMPDWSWRISNAALNDIWPGWRDAWIEARPVVTKVPGEQPETWDETGSSISYVDALENTVASVSDERWSITIPDAEGRPVLAGDPAGEATLNQYDAAGLLVRAETFKGGTSQSVTEYAYDTQGRQTKVVKDGKTVGATEYPHPAGGRREVIRTDAAGISVTFDLIEPKSSPPHPGLSAQIVIP